MDSRSTDARRRNGNGESSETTGGAEELTAPPMVLLSIASEPLSCLLKGCCEWPNISDLASGEPVCLPSILNSSRTLLTYLRRLLLESGVLGVMEDHLPMEVEGVMALVGVDFMSLGVLMTAGSSSNTSTTVKHTPEHASTVLWFRWCNVLLCVGACVHLLSDVLLCVEAKLDFHSSEPMRLLRARLNCRVVASMVFRSVNLLLI
mmetsp:Transcript_24398/g.38432  ORF Transcript_24398/g.38432 Transcript_24398/m.38432 type:complete len:205 (-) Transcript_24398:339-953(-)